MPRRQPDEPATVPMKKPVESDAESALDTETPAATEDEAAAPATVPMKKPVEGDAESAPDAETPAATEDEAAAPATVPMKKPVEGDAESAPDAETPAAKEDEAAAPATVPMKKPVEGNAESAPDAETPTTKQDEAAAPAAEPTKKPGEDDAEAATDSETPAAKLDEAAAATAELLKKPDDDISELVSGARPPATGEDETAAPTAEPMKESAEDDADSAPATEGAPAGEGAPATSGEDGATPAKPPTFRGTEETAAPQGTITIRELLEGTVEVGEHDVFYVHAVTSNDLQGLWGIIQMGVTENFARGVRITIGERTNTYRIAVPPDADEVLEDRSSSPLGLMIYRKSRETIVYNRKLGRLTQDPDVTLYPGNELIIVGFKPEELIGLYKHFAGADGG